MMSFYQFMMKHRNPYGKDPMSRLANKMSNDISFPKQNHDFHEISSHLEMSGEYGKLLTVFDEAWQQYSNLL